MSIFDLAGTTDGARKIAQMVVDGELTARDVTILALARVVYWARDMRGKIYGEQGGMNRAQYENMANIAMELHGELSELARSIALVGLNDDIAGLPMNNDIAGDGGGEREPSQPLAVSAEPEIAGEWSELMIGGKIMRVPAHSHVVLPEPPKRVVQTAFF